MLLGCYCAVLLSSGVTGPVAQDTLPPVRPPTAAAMQRLVRTPVSTIRSGTIDAIRAAAVIGNDLLLAGVSGHDMRSNIGRYNLATGALVSRLTRQGGGPGEMSEPRFMYRMPGDSLFVYDSDQRRYTVFSPGEYRYARGGPVSGLDATTVLPTEGRQILVAATMVGRQAVGSPIHLYAASGMHLASFGFSGRAPVRPGLGDARVLGVGRSGEIWSVTLRSPTVVERYSARGRLIQVIPYGRDADLQSPPRPAPQVSRLALQFVDAKHLWILSVVADSTWRRGILDRPGAGAAANRGEVAIGSLPLLYDSVIEVLDIQTGMIVARRRVDDFITHLLPSGYAIAHSESSEGLPVIRVERWSLRAP